MAMAAIVAQNGATGQSLVEQFTTGPVHTESSAEPSECVRTCCLMLFSHPPASASKYFLVGGLVCWPRPWPRNELFCMQMGLHSGKKLLQI